LLSPLVASYIVYVVSMTVVMSWAFERAFHGVGVAFWILILSSMTTLTFLFLFSYSPDVLLFSIAILSIPVTLWNLGKWRLGSVAGLLASEILMSLLYYVMLRGLGNAVIALDFYGTDIPSTYVNSPFQVLEALAELANSFMFFLMILPEILYFCVRNRDTFPLILGSLALGGPNIASEMTHSILPLPYDPVKEASIFVSLLSLVSSVYVSNSFMRGKLRGGEFLTFIISNLMLSVCGEYYAVTINEIPYALATLITLGLSFVRPKVELRDWRTSLILSVPQYLWGLSVGTWYNEISVGYLLGTLFLLTYLVSLSASHLRIKGADREGLAHPRRVR